MTWSLYSTYRAWRQDVAAETADFKLRTAGPADLHGINAVIQRAVMTWNLPERVKRLAMPTYLYTAHDLDHLAMAVAEDASGKLIGIAAWEPAAKRDCPDGRKGLLLHGLYVEPIKKGQGVGSKLLDAAGDFAHRQGYEGILVKAQAEAVGFFQAVGLRQVAIQDPGRDYPNRYWLELDPAPTSRRT
jgi:predicted N-acetyltransferase YhbS